MYLVTYIRYSTQKEGISSKPVWTEEIDNSKQNQGQYLYRQLTIVLRRASCEP